MQILPDLTAPKTYALFTAASKRDWLAYRAVFRGKLPDLIPDQAHIYVRDWLARETGECDPIGLIDMAEADDSLNGLGLVAAALLAMRQGRFAQAATLAERAYAADQHEIFAQRIFLSAKEERRDLHLAVDDWLADRFCSNPFTDVEVIQSRDIYTCCAAWLPAAIGAADDPDTDPWRGPRAQELRRSVLDGDFSYCSRLNCPKIAGRQLPRRDAVGDPQMRRHIDRQTPAIMPDPDRVLLSYDTSCNLSCPSCRVKLISLGRSQATKLDSFYEAHVAPLLTNASRIKITGSGDPFGSNHFRHVLRHLTAQKVEAPRLQLQTNGVLFDARAWDELGLEGHVKSVWVSVDATEPETYAILRRDGDFDRLMANLQFLASKRKAGQIGELRLDFVVQVANFRQMPAFAEMARDIGADGVHFLMLRNWGTFTPEVFQSMAVTFDTHPDHAEFLEVLNDPRLNAPGVDLGNLGQLRQPGAPAVRTTKTPPMGDPKDAKLILVLGVQRTGSNYLFGCLDRVKEFYTLREVFNPLGAFGMTFHKQMGLRHFGALLGQTFTSERDPRLCEYVRADPAETLQHLRGLAAGMGRNAVALKVFDNQLQNANLCNEILSDPAVVPVLLKRQLLASYISRTKARMANVWARKDVTGLRPEIDVDDYLQWQDATIGWYQQLEDAMQRLGKTPINLTYNQITRGSPREMLNALLSQLGQAGVVSMPIRDDFDPPLMRQDTTDDIFDRVANGNTLKNNLRSREQLQIALDIPLRPETRIY
ncbi:radical SAM/SPASM domain-containing protein [Yoonia sediminilitoris]|uniref:Uncharacterized protein n=1 Tax=Yoonia sediminilitoris TaxID=1286148 RepID=A0A2T6KMX7_9RHOB|nr:radical SAM/SPASM domain-containing protein [Yoonia sediminilitoris]PUB17572.1 hypothetical protein C8N45_102584 [Yoonia sediminilitoris]RCW97867.1 hypothetical protein DFP92_102584 [Yoonia sediminilitoris]